MRIVNLCLSTAIVSVTASISTLQISGPAIPVSEGAPLIASVEPARTAPKIRVPAQDWIVQAAAQVWDDFEDDPEDQASMRNSALLSNLRP